MRAHRTEVLLRSRRSVGRPKYQSRLASPELVQREMPCIAAHQSQRLSGNWSEARQHSEPQLAKPSTPIRKNHLRKPRHTYHTSQTKPIPAATTPANPARQEKSPLPNEPQERATAKAIPALTSTSLLHRPLSWCHQICRVSDLHPRDLYERDLLVPDMMTLHRPTPVVEARLAFNSHAIT